MGTILNYISDKIFSELALNQAMMFQIIGIALIGALFTNFSAAFAKKYVAETGFYLTYMIVFALLAASFLSALTIAQDVTGAADRTDESNHTGILYGADIIAWDYDPAARFMK